MPGKYDELPWETQIDIRAGSDEPWFRRASHGKHPQSRVKRRSTFHAAVVLVIATIAICVSG